MEEIVSWLNMRLLRSNRSAEVVVYLMVVLAGILIAAVNTIANVCVSSLVNTIGLQSHIHPYRRSTLLATGICTFPFVLPYGGCVLLLQKGIAASGADVLLSSTDVFVAAVYPWILFIVMFLECVLGIGKNRI